MAYGIRIEGLAEAQRLLGADFGSVLRSATKAVALEVQGEIAPYPPATEANSPGNARGKWYERGYGSRWLRKDGSVGGSKTSQMLGRRWAIRAWGTIGQVIGNAASYAKFVHGAGTQAVWHSRRGWMTDAAAVSQTVQSGVVKRIVVQAIVGAIRRRR